MNKLLYSFLVFIIFSCKSEDFKPEPKQIQFLTKLTIKTSDYGESQYRFQYDSMGRLLSIIDSSSSNSIYIETFQYKQRDKYPFRKESKKMIRVTHTTATGIEKEYEEWIQLQPTHYFYNTSSMTLSEVFNNDTITVYKYDQNGQIISKKMRHGVEDYLYDTQKNIIYSSSSYDGGNFNYIYDNSKNPFKSLLFFSKNRALLMYPVGYGANNITGTSIDDLPFYTIDYKYNISGHPTSAKIYYSYVKKLVGEWEYGYSSIKVFQVE